MPREGFWVKQLGFIVHSRASVSLLLARRSAWIGKIVETSKTGRMAKTILEGRTRHAGSGKVKN